MVRVLKFDYKDVFTDTPRDLDIAIVGGSYLDLQDCELELQLENNESHEEIDFDYEIQEIVKDNWSYEDIDINDLVVKNIDSESYFITFNAKLTLSDNPEDYLEDEEE